MSALRALRELTEQARQDSSAAFSAAKDAADRASTFFAFAAYAENYGDEPARLYAKDRAVSDSQPTRRQAFADILAILERPTVEVER